MTARTNASPGDRYLCFSLGKEQFALPLLEVREVIAYPTITPVPQSLPYCPGLMNLRGQVITVLDLRKKLGIKGEDGPELSVIICELEGVRMGLVVDAISHVLAPRADQLAEKPSVDAGKFASCIAGIFRGEQGLVLFLDIDRTLEGVQLSPSAQARTAA